MGIERAGSWAIGYHKLPDCIWRERGQKKSLLFKVINKVAHGEGEGRGRRLRIKEGGLEAEA